MTPTQQLVLEYVRTLAWPVTVITVACMAKDTLDSWIRADYDDR